MIVTRGGQFEAAFKSAATLTILDAQVYISAANTVDYADTTTKFPIGTLVERSNGGSGTSCKVSLYEPTKRGIAAGTVTAGARISQSTYKFVDATTGTVVQGIAVNGATVDGTKFEYIPLRGIAAIA
jgi:hypothetical protein